jgi:hypothetical protein
MEPPPRVSSLTESLSDSRKFRTIENYVGVAADEIDVAARSLGGPNSFTTARALNSANCRNREIMDTVRPVFLECRGVSE